MNLKENHNKLPFNVPEGYFDDLPDRILLKINNLPETNTPIHFRLLLRRQLAWAASFLAFVLLATWFYVTLIPKTNNKTIAQVTLEDVIVAHVEETDIIDELNSISEKKSLSPAEIVNYLADENIDTYAIYETINN